MQRDGDLLLNVSCSRNEVGKGNRERLPQRMPDGTKIDTNRNLKRKIAKTHKLGAGNVHIPKHKLPVLDEFGLSIPDEQDLEEYYRDADNEEGDEQDGERPDGKAGGRSNDEPDKKRRRSFVPGLNPRKREKSANVFTNSSLSGLGIHPYIVSNLEKNFEIKNLTKVQTLAIPKLLKGEGDFIINSGIGTGTYALVLVPTRELAAKVSEVFRQLCQSCLWVVPGLLTGGERKKSEKARLKKGLNIMITTPGRLIDHMEHSKNMEFSKLRYCVLGDAHRLLDPEREEVSKKIVIILRKRLPKTCARCVVTATVTKKLEKFYEILVKNPNVIDAFKQFE